MHIKQLWVGVGVHRQVDAGVTHRGLGGSRRHASLAEQRPERMPQGVDVERPAPLVCLVDPSRLKVTVKDAHQPGGNGEQRPLTVAVMAITA
ncbi:MAG TPA: hypothetical protein VM165_15120 [Planctomycetaceae bacterium]|nr:hypothetical protein [Planctomycetaceae bacterium]